MSDDLNHEIMTAYRRNGRKSTPQNLPGDFATAEALQQWNIRRKYAIGFHLDFAIGVNTFPQISFPGMARMLLGWSMFDDTQDPNNLITMNLNNENMVTDMSWVEYTKVNQFPAATLATGTSFKEEYYSYPRALSGTDGLVITYTAVTTGRLFVSFYYKSILELTKI